MAPTETAAPRASLDHVSAAAPGPGRWRDLVCRTPLIHSRVLSEALGTRVLLKLDALQPSGSFKDRGMAYMCAELQKRGTEQLISSSGGNAGFAAATMGGMLGLKVRVIVPETTKQLMIDKIRGAGAEVQVHGANWNEADVLARSLVEANPSAAYVSPYDDPLLWTGHSSLVDELAEAGVRPGAIVASVGGGGLLNGLYLGLQRHGWEDVRLVTAETDGANCFAAARAAGVPTRLPAIASVATSLGALECSPTSLELAAAHCGGTDSCAVSDAEAVGACADFLRDHRLLVEPACGAALALLRAPRHRAVFAGLDSVVVVVCGGSGVSWEIMEEWRRAGLWSTQPPRA
jgi:L-serine/L-threonine ammonia-lyase